jgi:hypothetical protein
VNDMKNNSAGPMRMYVAFGALYSFIFAVLIGLSPMHLDTFAFLAGCGALIGLWLGWLRRRGFSWSNILAWFFVGFFFGLFRRR